ncbi:MAG: hypothetical protein ITG01_01850 [Comamonas sp.]|nr:hypothetical protein [Comamonas sp.]
MAQTIERIAQASHRLGAATTQLQALIGPEPRTRHGKKAWTAPSACWPITMICMAD